MRDERSIDSNACICLDGRNNEAAVFGRGIESVCPPQDLPSDLIGRTFPEAASSETGLLQSIPEEAMSITPMKRTWSATCVATRQNLVLVLADRIGRALRRYELGGDCREVSALQKRPCIDGDGLDIVPADAGMMKKRYGFIYINTDDRCQGSMKRCRKDCFWWYKKAIASNRADLG